MLDESKKNNVNKYRIDKISRGVFLASALIAVVSLLVIIGFVFYKGLTPFISKGYSIIDFITGTEWFPSSDKFGVLPMILASIFGTIGAVLIGVPVGLFCAVFISEVASKKVASIMVPAVELLAGIPSVLYGVFGLAVIVPFIQNTFNLPRGQSLLAIIIVLSIMMLPTIIAVSTTAIKSVPKAYKEGSLALGASHMETIFKVVIPAAKSGVLAAIMLGVGRAIGETMAIILVAGNAVLIPESIFDSVRPLTSNIALEMGYAYGTHQEMLFATGVILFIFIIILNLVISKLSNKEGR